MGTMIYTTEQIARVCHEANRTLQIFNGEPVSAPWPELDVETQNSAIDGVHNAMEGVSPEQSHENWCLFKISHGWAYGELKDDRAKTHPNLVNYAELPADQRIKDALFLAIARALTDG